MSKDRDVLLGRAVVVTETGGKALVEKWAMQDDISPYINYRWCRGCASLEPHIGSYCAVCIRVNPKNRGSYA